ncbi:molybdate ABC transporter substrate-binding protein [Puniceibacterium sediminis]|uniref:Molybdate transport system substrate-binding protein n=1 Tax=Puniceibacterium sediminis TaxID=1608407 RepID=A0A238Y222_9RHOB|nr:molybdate ABC transporter substrate-binding protein [Puniceibacterium sediminis]SNR64841.1 molybdate transport system substrate-binding protein [Puniceibacterium sediminis]
MHKLRGVRSLTLWLVLICCAVPLRAAEIMVFAAASTGDALTEAAQVWEAETGNQVTLAPAGSSALARQIAAGAPVDIFLSANPEWMDWLDGQGMIDPETRRILMGNALVLIRTGPAWGKAVDITPDFDIAARLGPDARLAMALVEAVPAGIYGKAALEWLGQWDALAPRVAQADNVRAALALVALGEAPYGIVYATDAVAERRVHVAATFPEESHPPILYPGAVTRDAAEPEAAEAFLDWLAGPEGGAILQQHGFVLPSE